MHEDEKTEGGPIPLPVRGPGEHAALRPRHCWEIVRQLPGLHFNCEECYAYFVQQDCWTLWALRRPGSKPCCQKQSDCAACAVLSERMRPRDGEQLEITRMWPKRPAPSAAKRICAYLQLYSRGEPIEGNSRGPAIARALPVRNADFRCRRRGVHLDTGYVNDLCVSRHIEECAFLDESRPEVRVLPLPMIAKQVLTMADTRHGEKGSDQQPVPLPSAQPLSRVEG